MAAPQEKPKGAEGISISISPDALMHLLSTIHGGKSGPGGTTGEAGQGSSGPGTAPLNPELMWSGMGDQGKSGAAGHNPFRTMSKPTADYQGTSGPGGGEPSFIGTIGKGGGTSPKPSFLNQ